MKDEAPARWWLVLLGVPIGFASSLCGIGGGLFAGSLLHFLLRFDLRRSTGTALVLVLATTSASTATELLRSEPALELGVVLAAIVGVWSGAKIGFQLSERLSERVLQGLFCVVLFVAALRIFLAGGGAEQLQEPVTRHVLHYLLATLVGLAGGMAAPLLGVGGGLLMVPGFFLLVPGTEFDAARATSLAVGVFGSLRALRLKASAGRVSWGHGLRLGLGALLGAACGVTALDAVASLVEAGRILLGCVLLLVSVRFAREWWAGRAG